METYVIPDIHENIEWSDSILARKKPEDYAVFLGDYFHQFDQDRTGEVCVWLKKMLERRDATLLLGNHDQAHIAHALHMRGSGCSGWSARKQAVFDAHFSDPRELQKELRVVHIWPNGLVKPLPVIMISHAGLGAGFAKEQGVRVEHRQRVLLEGDVSALLYQGWQEWLAGQETPALLKAGKDRGGDQFCGGVTWGDWRNFEPIPGIQQIVGHTPLSEPEEKDGNWCIDTNQRHYAVVDETGQIRIEELTG